EPDRVYYAVVDGSLDLDELVRWGQGVITFLCPDPYKYGQERTLRFPADAVVIENKGTAEVNPIFELTAKKKTTFAMLTKGDEEYYMINKSSDDDLQLVEKRTSVL